MKLNKSSKSFVTCVLALSLATASTVPMDTPAFAVGAPTSIVMDDGGGGSGKAKTPAKKATKSNSKSSKKSNTKTKSISAKKNNNIGAKKNNNTSLKKQINIGVKKRNTSTKKNTARNTAPKKKNNVASKKDTSYKESYEYKRHLQEQAKQTASKKTAAKKSAPKPTPDRIANTYTISNEGKGDKNITYTLREAEKVAKNAALTKKTKNLSSKKDDAYKKSHGYKSVMDRTAKKSQNNPRDKEAYKKSVLYIGPDKGQAEKDAVQKKKAREFFDNHPSPYWEVPNSREDARVKGGIKKYMGEKSPIRIGYESSYPTVHKTTVKDIMEQRKEIAEGKMKKVKKEDRIPIQTLNPSYEARKKYEGLFLSDSENERIGNFQVNEKGESYGFVGDKNNYRFKFISGQEKEAESKFALDRTWIDRGKLVSNGLAFVPSTAAQTVAKGIDGTAAVLSVGDAIGNAQNRAITYRGEGGTVVKESLHDFDWRNEEVFAPNGSREVADEEYLNWDLYKHAGKDILDLGGHFIKAGLAEEALYNGASELAYKNQEKVVDTAVNTGKLAIDIANNENPTDTISYVGQAGKIVGIEGADLVDKGYKVAKGIDKEWNEENVYHSINNEVKGAVQYEPVVAEATEEESVVEEPLVQIEEPQENLPVVNITDGEGTPLIQFEEAGLE